jgi:adenine-specific DNA-methyltransferase
MLKLEPGEAAQIVLPEPGVLKRIDPAVIEEAIGSMREWRHYASRA